MPSVKNQQMQLVPDEEMEGERQENNEENSKPLQGSQMEKQLETEDQVMKQEVREQIIESNTHEQIQIESGQMENTVNTRDNRSTGTSSEVEEIRKRKFDKLQEKKQKYGEKLQEKGISSTPRNREKVQEKGISSAPRKLPPRSQRPHEKGAPKRTVLTELVEAMKGAEQTDRENDMQIMHNQMKEMNIGEDGDKRDEEMNIGEDGDKRGDNVNGDVKVQDLEERDRVENNTEDHVENLKLSGNGAPKASLLQRSRSAATLGCKIKLEHDAFRTNTKDSDNLNPDESESDDSQSDDQIQTENQIPVQNVNETHVPTLTRQEKVEALKTYYASPQNYYKLKMLQLEEKIRCKKALRDVEEELEKDLVSHQQLQTMKQMFPQIFAENTQHNGNLKGTETIVGNIVNGKAEAIKMKDGKRDEEWEKLMEKEVSNCTEEERAERAETAASALKYDVRKNPNFNPELMLMLRKKFAESHPGVMQEIRKEVIQNS
jgi:hypothetical protein